MSRHDVDERVVQMEFDNARFEQNVSQSMSTLDKLKEKLKFTDSTKDFQAINKSAQNVDFASLSASIDALNGRFSAFGIVGMTVMQRLTNAAIDLGAKLLGSVAAPLNQIKTGGWNRALNIENAMFKMSGLLEDFEEQKQKIDENIDYAVSGTAYSYDAAASAMAQLTASGVEFRGTSMDMKNALRAISGVAAMTNSEYSAIADVFTTVAGNGKLMTMQLNQLSGRGINAAAALGKQLGKSEAEIREMVTKGKIDFQTFANAMDQAFGEHAKKANDTFTGALSNIKAALSRTGQGFAQSLQHYGRDILNYIRPNINKFNKQYLGPLVDDFDAIMAHIAGVAKRIFGDGSEGILYLGWVPQAIRTIENVALGLLSIFNRAKEAISAIFDLPAAQKVSDVWGKIEDYSARFRDALTDAKGFIKPIEDTANNAADAVGKVTKSAEELEEIAKRVIRGEFGNGQVRFDALEEMGYNWKEVQNRVNEILGCSFRYEIELEDIADATEDITDEQRKQAALNKDVVGTTLSSLEEYVTLNGEVMTAEQARERRLENIRDTLKGVAAIMKIVKLAVDAVRKVVIDPFLNETLPRILDKILEITAKIGRQLVQLADDLEKNKWFEHFFENILKLLKDAFQLVVDIGKEVVNFIASLNPLEKAADLFGKFIDFIKDIPQHIREAYETFKEFLGLVGETDGFKHLSDVVGDMTSSVGEFVSGKGNDLLSWFEDIDSQENVQGAADKVGAFADVLADLLEYTGELGRRIQDLADKLEKTRFFEKLLQNFPQEASKAFDEFFGNLLSGDPKDFDTSVDNLANTIGESLKSVFGKIKWGEIDKVVRKATLLGFMFLVGKLIAGIANLTKNASDVPKNFSKLLGNTAKAIEAYTSTFNAEALMTVSKAIAVLVGSLILLAFVGEKYPEGLVSAVSCMVAIAFGMSVLISAISKLGFFKFSGEITSVPLLLKYYLAGIVKSAGLIVTAAGIVGTLILLAIGLGKLASIIKTYGKGIIGSLALMAGMLAAILVSVKIISLIAKALTKTDPAALDKLIPIAASMVGIGASLYLTALALQALGSVKLSSAFAAILVLAALVAATIALTKMIEQNSGMLKAMGVMLGMVLVINATVLPLILLSKLIEDNGKSIIIAAVMLTAIIAAVGYAAGKLSSLSLASVAATILAIAAAILILSYAMDKLAEITADRSLALNLVVVIGVLAALTALMVGLSYVLGTDGAASLLMIATSFTLISVAVLAFAAALYVLGAALPKLAQGLAEFGQILINNAPQIALAVAAIVGAIALGIVASKFKLVSAGSTMIESLVVGLSNSWPNVLKFIKDHGVTTVLTLIAVVITTLVFASPLLVAGLIDVLNKVADSLEARKSEIASAFIRVLVAVLNIIIEAFLEIVGVITKGIGGIIGKVMGLFGKSFDTAEFNAGADKAKTGISNKLDEIYNEIGRKVDDGNTETSVKMGEGAAEATEQFNANFNPNGVVEEKNGNLLDTLSSFIPTFGGSGSELGTAGTEGFNGTFNLTGGAETALTGFTEQMSEALPGVGDMSTMLGETGAAGFGEGFDLSNYVSDELTGSVPSTILDSSGDTNSAMMSWADMSTDGVGEYLDGEGFEIGSLFSQGVADGATSSDATAELISANDELFSQASDDAYTHGQTLTEKYSEGELSQEPLVTEAGTKLVAANVTGVEAGHNDMLKSGLVSGFKYAEGVNNQQGTAKVAGMSLKNSAVNGASGSYGRMYDEGSNAGEGFYDGLGSWADAIASRAYRIVSDAVQSAKDAERSASPSKETRKLGVYFDQGFILGLEDLAGKVRTTAGNVADNGLSAMRDAVSKIRDILASDMDYEPTIRPVMDLSEVEAGARMINSTLASSASFTPAMSVDGTAAVSSLMNNSSLRVNSANITGNSDDIAGLLRTTDRILTTLKDPRPITIDGTTVIGWIDRELGAFV